MEMIKNGDLQFIFRRSKFLGRGSFNSVNQEMNVQMWKTRGIRCWFPQMASLLCARTIIDWWTREVDCNGGLELSIVLQRLSQYESRIKWIRYEYSSDWSWIKITVFSSRIGCLLYMWCDKFFFLQGCNYQAL